LSHRLLVILGIDSEKKPHAARFDVADEAAVRKAAAHKGFRIGHAKTKDAAELAGKLIEGRIFDSGRGLVPFVSVEIFQKLEKLLAIEPPAQPTEAAAPPKDTPAPKGAASDLWAAIKVGSVILCRDPQPGPDRSFWECVVTETSRDGKSLKVKWQNYPTLKQFTVKRAAVAILPPKN
jgi:hypothetical protein